MVYLTSCLIIIVILLVLKIYRMNLMVIMGLRMRVLKSLLRLNLCLFKWFWKKSVSSQIEDFQKLVSNLAKEGDVLLEWFVAHGLAFKLLDS